LYIRGVRIRALNPKVRGVVKLAEELKGSKKF